MTKKEMVKQLKEKRKPDPDWFRDICMRKVRELPDKPVQPDKPCACGKMVE